MPGTLHWLHPMFYAYFNGGNSFPNIYAEILMTACGGNNLSWVCGTCVDCLNFFIIIENELLSKHNHQQQS